MRQKSLTSYATPSKRIATRRSSAGRRKGGITITPMRGFFITLLCLGVPTVSLGTVCLSLIQNNLRLSETNDELKEMANEVKAEVDSLGSEIDSLRERAGVPKLKESVSETNVQDRAISETGVTKAKQSNWSDSIQRGSEKGAGEGIRSLSDGLPPKGGPANVVDPVSLLKNVQREVPKLNHTLDSSVKPALEKALAEEAAYPDGTPVVGIVEVSSEFGIRRNPFGGSSYEMHEGIDFAGDYDDIIAATGDGVVTLAGPKGGYGITITIDHGYGYETLYAHLTEVKVEPGDTVKRGQIIGYMGSTGRSTGPHLHYSIYKDEQAIDPRKLLKLPENNLAQGPR